MRELHREPWNGWLAWCLLAVILGCSALSFGQPLDKPQPVDEATIGAGALGGYQRTATPASLDPASAQTKLGSPLAPEANLGQTAPLAINSGALISNNAAALSGSVLVPAQIVANNSLGYHLSSQASVPLQGALVYLSDTRERLYFDPLTREFLTTHTDVDGKFRFSKAPATDSIVVNAVLSGNRRMVGFVITRPGDNQVSLGIASTLATEFLRHRALIAGADKTLGSYDPELKVVPRLVQLTDEALGAGKLTIPDLVVGKIPMMTQQYLVGLCSRALDLKRAWENLLGETMRIVETLAGDHGGFAGDGGPAARARFSNPFAIARAADGTLFIADSGNNRIRMIDVGGKTTTVAGGGDPSDISRRIAAGEKLNPLGDGGPAIRALLQEPRGVAAIATPLGTALLITEFSGMRLRLVEPAGKIHTLIANPNFDKDSVEGPLAIESPRPTLWFPTTILEGPDGSFYLANTFADTVRRLVIPPLDIGSATIELVAGTYDTRAGLLPADGTDAKSVDLHLPTGLCFDNDKNLYVAEAGGHDIIRISPAGKVFHFAGKQIQELSGDGGPAKEAGIIYPVSLAFDARANRILVGSYQSPRIRSIDLGTGIISTLAGAGESAEDGLAQQASLTDVSGLAMEPSGNVLFLDTQSSRLRRLWLVEPPP